MSNFTNPKIVKDKTSYGPVTLFFCVILAPLALLFIFCYTIFGGIYSGRVLDHRGRGTTATVTKAHCDRGHRSVNACRVKVVFYDTKYQKTDVSLDVTRSLVERVRVGDALPITYDPQKTQRARVSLPEYSRPYWLLIVQTWGWVLGGFVAAGVIWTIWIRFKPYYKNAPKSVK